MLRSVRAIGWLVISVSLITCLCLSPAAAQRASERPPYSGCIEARFGIDAFAALLAGYEEIREWNNAEKGFDVWLCPRFQPAAPSPPPEEQPTLPKVETETPSTNLRPTEQVAGKLGNVTFSNAAFETTGSIGGALIATHWKNQQDFSSNSLDPTMPLIESPTNGSFVGGVGVKKDLLIFIQPTIIQPLEYAPVDKPAGFPAVLPTKAPPRPPLPARPLLTFGVEGNIYFFAGGNSTINGIPGGPGITPTGNDSFNFRDRYLLTAGGYLAAPIKATWTAAVTGGFAEADKSATYNCGTYCTTGGITPFSVSKDVWLPGAYVGGRIEMPLAIAAWPGTTVGFDYKHIFLASQNVLLGNVAVRAISQSVSGDIDMFMVRLAVPLAR